MTKFRFAYFVIFLTSLIACKTEEPQNPPTVVTMVASDVTLKNATLNGEITDEGYSATTDRGFVFSDKNINPSVSDTKVQSGYGKGLFSIVLDKLPAKTKYYYKAYATNTKGTSYGVVQSFTTADYSLPTLITDVPKNVSYTTAELGGVVTNDGGATISERGVCFGLNPNPTILDTKVISGKGIGSFNLNAINLKDNAKYYVRAYAINVKGTAYGNEQTFTTIEYKLPTFVNKEANSIGSTSFMFGTDITDDGGTDIVERGFCYSTSTNPIISDLKVKIGNGKGAYFSTILGLKENTIYYIRPYAINSKGVGYGTQQTIKTIAQSAISSNLKEGILAFYPLNGNANDASGNGINLIIKGVVGTNTTGKDRFGNSLSCFGFDMAGGAVTSTSKINDSKNGFSISFWSKSLAFNPNSGISYPLVGLNLINSNSKEMNFYINQRNYFFGSEFKKTEFNLKSKIIFDNEWHHFTAVFDYQNNIIQFYIDGNLEASTSSNVSNLGLLNLSIGAVYQKLYETTPISDIYNRYAWAGYMDDVGFWNRTLSLDEIKYLQLNSFKP